MQTAGADMSLSVEKILSIVTAIQNTNVPNKAAYFANTYANFMTKYPVLYEQACKNEKMDLKTLQFMLNMLEKMQTDDLTQHDASANVGQLLYDKYIHDRIKDLPPTKK